MHLQFVLLCPLSSSGTWGKANVDQTPRVYRSRPPVFSAMLLAFGLQDFCKNPVSLLTASTPCPLGSPHPLKAKTQTTVGDEIITF